MATEKRLIDANALEEMVKFIDKPAWMIVRDAPTVDAVEVVRCKDCKYFAIGGADRPWCRHESGLNDDVEPDYFCSYGERRTDG